MSLREEKEMKRLLFVFVVAALVVGLFAVAALAEESFPGVPETVYAFDEDTNPENARVWRLYEGWDTTCNQDREEDVTIKANVAQWAKWSCDFRGWEWYVRKPGDYFADCIQGHVQSNGSVAITFVGFGDLEAEGAAVNPTIGTFYAALTGSGEPSPDDWVAACELSSVTIGDSLALHTGMSWKLWNRIVVVDCNSPGVYGNYPTLELTLLNQATWLDDEGEFISPPAPYPIDENGEV